MVNILPVTESLLYCPAGKSQVVIAARMITIIKIGIGPGKDLFIAMWFYFSSLIYAAI
jgi:hypothetical protein